MVEPRGDWGETLVEQYTRGNGLLPLLHMSSMGMDMALVVPRVCPEPRCRVPNSDKPTRRQLFVLFSDKEIVVEKAIELSVISGNGGTGVWHIKWF
ncbi:hypothetical protein ACFLT3_01810 [Chloroflexota bacterium]